MWKITHVRKFSLKILIQVKMTVLFILTFQERFTECRLNHTRDYESLQRTEERDGPKGPGAGGLCSLLTEMMAECGKAWQVCHSPEEMRVLEGMHVAAFQQQWPASLQELKGCPLYEEFR